MAIEIVDLPSYKMVMFHSYVSLPEGNMNVIPSYNMVDCWLLVAIYCSIKNYHIIP